MHLSLFLKAGVYKVTAFCLPLTVDSGHSVTVHQELIWQCQSEVRADQKFRKRLLFLNSLGLQVALLVYTKSHSGWLHYGSGGSHSVQQYSQLLQ